MVFYGYAPAMGFWLLRLFGHQNARILNVDRDVWQRERRPWTGDVAKPASTQYPLPPEIVALRSEASDVEQARHRPAAQLVDVRSESEYRGERFWPSGGMEPAGRAGHIRGAVHVPMDGLIDSEGRFASPEELRHHFAMLAQGPADDVIVYCTIGGRASTAWFALTELLGVPRVRVYDGSWADWGRIPGSAIDSSAEPATAPTI